MSENGKLVAILSYLLVGIIWYFADEKVKNDKLAKLHVKQALMLIIVGIALTIINIIPFIGWLIYLLGTIVLFVFWVMGIIYAINGQKKKIPLIGDLVEKVLTF